MSLAASDIAVNLANHGRHLRASDVSPRTPTPTASAAAGRQGTLRHYSYRLDDAGSQATSRAPGRHLPTTAAPRGRTSLPGETDARARPHAADACATAQCVSATRPVRLPVVGGWLNAPPHLLATLNGEPRAAAEVFEALRYDASTWAPDSAALVGATAPLLGGQGLRATAGAGARRQHVASAPGGRAGLRVCRLSPVTGTQTRRMSSQLLAAPHASA